MNVLTLQSDYPVLSLTRLSAPVKIIERTILDTRVIEGMEGVLELEETDMAGTLVTELELQGTVMEEEAPVATLTDEEPMDGVFVTEEEMVGVFDPEC